MDKAKELSKSPFKMTNKLQKEKEIIQKLINSVTKKTVISDLADALNNEFEVLLNKTKDPIQAWVRGNALDEMGFTDSASLFKAKASELGYVIENKTTNENMEKAFKYKCVINFELESDMPNGDDVKQFIFNLLDGTEIGGHIGNTTVIVEPIQLTENIAVGNGVITGCIPSENKITEEQHPDNNAIYNAIIAKYPLSEILQGQVSQIIANYDNGNAEKTFGDNDFNETINAISAIVSDTFANVEQLVKSVDPEITLENHKQQFMYSPQEETKWAIMRDENNPLNEKPAFNSIALRHMISDDAFLKFSYHNLSTGEEAKDLEMIYNTYIKGDEDMVSKLKTYESYTFRVLENMIAKDIVSQTIADMLKEFGVEVEDETANEGIMIDAITKVSDKVKEYAGNVKSAFALYTPEVKAELKDVFGKLSLKEIVTKIKESGITLDEIKTAGRATENQSENTLTQKIVKSFGLSTAAAGFVVMVFGVMLPGMSGVMHSGAMPATYLFGIGAGILILSGLGLSYTK